MTHYVLLSLNELMKNKMFIANSMVNTCVSTDRLDLVDYCADKTVIRLSYLYNGISHSGKTQHLYIETTHKGWFLLMAEQGCSQ